MAASRSYLGQKVDATNLTTYTFSTGFTLTAGRVLAAIGGRAAGAALTPVSVTIGGTAATILQSVSNADAPGVTRALFAVADTAAVNNDIVVVWSTAAVRASCGVWNLTAAAATAYATASSVADGNAADQTTTIATPAGGLLFAFFTNTGGASWRHSGGSALTSLSAAVTVTADENGGNTIWTGVTEETGFDSVVEAGASSGDGVMIAMSIAVSVQTLTPTKVTDADSFGVAIVGRHNTVLPTRHIDVDIFGTAIVSRGGQTLSPTKVTDADSFGAAVVGRGPRTLALTKFSDADTFGLPRIGRVLSPTNFTDADSFGTPAVGTGLNRTLTATKFSDPDSFGVPIVGGAPAQRAYLGPAQSAVDAASYTFSSGYTLSAGRIVVAVAARAASALDIVSVTAAGAAMTLVKKDTNPDGFGATTAGLFEVTLSSVANNNIVVTLSAAAARCGIDVYLLTNVGSVYASASGIQDGSGQNLSTTVDTPANGVAIGVAFMAGVGGNNQMSAASAQTTLQTAMAVSTGNAGAAGITWAGLTEDAGSDVLLEAGVNGDGVLVVASWAAGVVVQGALAPTRYLNPDSFGVPTVSLGGSSLPTVTPAHTAFNIVDGIAVNVQMNRTDRAYSYYGESSYARVIANANYLGTPHVRSVGPDTASPYYPRGWESLAEAGLKLCLHTPGASSYSALKAAVAQMRLVNDHYPGSVAFVEGPNEIALMGWPAYTDRFGVSYPGGNQSIAHVKRQDDTYYLAYTEPTTKISGVQVYTFTTANEPQTGGAQDFFNGHTYPRPAPGQVWWYSGISDSSPLPERINNSFDDWLRWDLMHPLVITEIGWYTNTVVSSGWGGVDTITQAILVIIAIFERANRPNFTRFYYYEMYDGAANSTSQEDYFGLWGRPPAPGGDVDWIPKLSATAIHNFIGLIGNANPAIAGLRYTLTGLPSTGRQVLIQKAVGEWLLFVWNMAPIWNYTGGNPTGSAITPAASTLTLSLSSGYSALWYSPAQGTGTVAASLTKYPLVAKIVSSGGPVAQNLSPTKFNNVASFKIPVVGRGAVVLFPTKFTDTADSFGVSVVRSVSVLSPTKLTDADSFGAPAVARGAVSLAPTRYSDPDVFWSPTGGRGGVGFSPTKAANVSSFGSPTVGRGGVTISPAVFADADSFGAAAIAPLRLLPTIYADPDSFGSPIVARQSPLSQTLALTKLTDADGFGSPAVSKGAVQLSPAHYDDADVFRSPTISAGVATILPTRYVDADVVMPPVVSRGVIALAPYPLIDTDAFGVPAVTARHTLLATRYIDPDAYGGAVVGVTTPQLHATLFIDPDNFGFPRVRPGRLGQANGSRRARVQVEARHTFALAENRRIRA